MFRLLCGKISLLSLVCFVFCLLILLYLLPLVPGFSHCKKVFLTATPYRADGKSLPAKEIYRYSFFFIFPKVSVLLFPLDSPREKLCKPATLSLSSD